jgi:hypothetical protein
LHSVRSRRAEAAADVQDQITRASSWNATVSRRCFVDGQFVVSSAKVLDERVASDHDASVAVLLEAAHPSKPRLQPAVVALNAVVGMAVGAVPCRWQQALQHGRVHRCLIGGDLDGVTLVALMARSKNRRAAVASRRTEMNTSMTWPNWSIAR